MQFISLWSDDFVVLSMEKYLEQLAPTQPTINTTTCHTPTHTLSHPLNHQPTQFQFPELFGGFDGSSLPVEPQTPVIRA